MLLVRLTMKEAMTSGIRADVRIQPKLEAAPTIIITMAVPLPEFISSWGRSFSFRS